MMRMTTQRWVETDDYVGLCRREARPSLRLIERRRVALALDEPSLATLLRRLRMTRLEFANDLEQHRFTLRLEAAAAIAEQQGQIECAQRLRDALGEIETGSGAVAIGQTLKQAAETLA
jgi:hypothetical protein